MCKGQRTTYRSHFSTFIMWVPELIFKSSSSVASILASQAILVASKDASLIKRLDYQRCIQCFKEITGVAKQWCRKINQECNSLSHTTNKKLSSYQNEIAKTVNTCVCCTEGFRFLTSFFQKWTKQGAAHSTGDGRHEIFFSSLLLLVFNSKSTYPAVCV